MGFIQSINHWNAHASFPDKGKRIIVEPIEVPRPQETPQETPAEPVKTPEPEKVPA